MTDTAISSTRFTHPLARGAKIWVATLRDGSSHKLLAVVTTLKLDSQSKRFKEDKVSRLKEAINEWLSENPTEAGGYILLERFRDWD
jgi:hypothetical protein